MDPRFGSIALLTLILSYPTGSCNYEGADDQEVGDILEVYRETLQRRIGDELSDLYSAYDDLTECISKLSIKIHASGLTTSENASNCLMINAGYKKAIHDLLQVSAALLARIALSLSPTTGAMDRAFKLMRHIWPPQNLAQRQVALTAAYDIWLLNVNELYSNNLRIRKLTAEVANALSYLSSISDRLLTVRITHTSPTQDAPQIKAAIQWTAEDDLIGVSAEDALAIKNDLEKLAEVQSELTGKVADAADRLDSMEHSNALTASNTHQAVDQLAQASKLQTAKWPFTCAAVGAVIGSAIGLIGGPPGMLIGASAGGALGGSAGKALKTRHHEVMTQVIRRGSFSSALNEDDSDLKSDMRRSESSALRKKSVAESTFQSDPGANGAETFSPDIRDSSNRATWLGCHGVPVLLDRPRFQNS